MNRIRRKLNNQKGASITMALLIFLVCTVVGSAVLVAGTVASGRMSKIAENDQRYYAVSSAARMLMKMVDNRTVTIIKSPGEGGSSSYTDQAGNSLEAPFHSIVQEAAYHLVSTNNSQRSGYQISIASSGIPALAVDVTEDLTADGSMTLTVSGAGEAAGGAGVSPDDYSLRVYFNGDLNVIKDTEIGDVYNYTWHLRDIEVVGTRG